MAQRSTRNKIRFQVKSAGEDLIRAQTHFAQAAALAEDQHPKLDEYLPEIMNTVKAVIEVTDQMYGEL